PVHHRRGGGAVPRRDRRGGRARDRFRRDPHGRREPGRQHGPGGAAGGDDGGARRRRPAHGAPPRGDPPAVGRGDAGLDHDHLQRQDGDADAERDDGDRDRPPGGPIAGGHGRGLRAPRGAPRGRPRGGSGGRRGAA